MRVLRRVTFIILLVLLACSGIGLLGGLNWFLDLFNSFRPQAVCVAALLMIYAVYFRWRSCIAVGLVVIVLNGSLMAARMIAFGGAEEADQAAKPVKLISANVLASNRQWSSVMNLVARERPDIIVVVEVTHEWADALKLLPKEYAHSLVEARFGVFGMAAYSRQPFTGHVLRVGARELPLFYMDFGSFVLMAAHPPPPVTNELATEHRLYIEEIADRARHAAKPVIVAGDFNGTLWNNSMRPLNKAGLRSSHPSGLAWTWPTGFVPFAMQIDHVLVRDAAVRDFRVLMDIGSDHRPIRTSFAPLTGR